MAPPRGRNGNVNFPAMVRGGENVNGYRAQTANGTASDEGGPFGYDYFGDLQTSGPRWNHSPTQMPEKAPRRSGPTRRGRGNLTGL
jgi:hypothetical protein